MCVDETTHKNAGVQFNEQNPKSATFYFESPIVHQFQLQKFHVVNEFGQWKGICRVYKEDETCMSYIADFHWSRDAFSFYIEWLFNIIYLIK